MTSSLVGSEMCIRDRFSNRRPACRGLRRLEPQQRQWILRQAWSASSDVCLLYTSDAADDM
eukprot:12792095-Prorocentrum_lima.AAC.1